MLLSAAEFRVLPFVERLGIVLGEGTYLATRYEEEDIIKLYHVTSFFVEVYYDPKSNHLHQCFAFTSVDGLEDYTAYVRLGELGL